MGDWSHHCSKNFDGAYEHSFPFHYIIFQLWQKLWMKVKEEKLPSQQTEWAGELSSLKKLWYVSIATTGHNWSLFVLDMFLNPLSVMLNSKTFLNNKNPFHRSFITSFLERGKGENRIDGGGIKCQGIENTTKLFWIWNNSIY